jgi:hypothetical protein
MASVETYRTRISTLKTSIETLKGGGLLTIRNLPGRADLVVNDSSDLLLPFGTVIAGDGQHVYLRVPRGSIYWVSSDRARSESDGYSLERFLDRLFERAADGEQFRIVYQPDA